MADYSFQVNNANFQPFSLQELLTPFLMYKDAFEKAENSYEELSKADEFKYLDETIPEGSKSRGIYDNYANDLHSAAKDLAENGLNMGNRSALTSLRQRYVGEIGRLQKANAALEEAKKFRKTLDAQDPSRIHAVDTSNLTIDDYLDGKTPNEYNVSGNDLYAKAAAAVKGISSRIFKTEEGRRLFNNYYIDYVQKRGFTQEDMDRFLKDASQIPALQNAINDILDETGVNDNLQGAAKRRAGKYVLRGIMDNAIYEEQHSPQRDLGMIDATSQAQMDLTRRGQDISLATQGMTYDAKTGTVTYNADNDPQLQKAIAIAEAKAGAKQGNGSQGSGETTKPQLKNGIVIEWKGDDPDAKGADNGPKSDKYNVTIKDKDSDNLDHEGHLYLYDNLPNSAKEQVIRAVGTGGVSNYVFYYRPYKEGIVSDTNAMLEIEPKTTVKGKADPEINYGETGSN